MSATSAGGLSSVAPLFAALGDETRLALVDRLCQDGSLSITQLAAGFAITRQAVTKQLEVLSRAGLIHEARRGRECLWTFDPDRMVEARRYLDEVSLQWDRALWRLKDFVER